MKRTLVLLVVLLVTFGVADGRQPPDQQVGARWALAGITWYQRTLSSRLPVFGVSCRFVPTCSRYAHAVIGEHGLWRGTGLTLGRLARCGPWRPDGTMDPPPHRDTEGE
ncbi:MAG: membrane protein insertion efficiency factor YidD [Vicinamibacterales bacterium]|nr:membrane protein insertion efficiency factor YidD [Vicinamibacterales bacterium]HJN44763.1 membrane protein insertion efficiency factor YidD [Vicinamibacterales bacterium]